MSIPDGQYKRLVEYNAIGGDKTKIVKKKAVTNDDDDDATDTESNVDKDGELDKEIAKEVSNRAKVLGRNDWGLFFIGGIGAILAGLVFPGWGVVFAFMIELLYYPVFECTENGTGYTAPDGRNFDTCQDYWDAEADYLREFSIKITYAWVGIIASTLIGNTMLFYGFGAATEKMNKRVRDAIFIALMKQDIGYFDTNSVGTLSTKLEEDAAMMHSFSGEPIRQLTMMVASVLVGLFISFWYMW
jgi:ATP-binding cassette subfamily B (MDR/TAP) protein 1